MSGFSKFIELNGNRFQIKLLEPAFFQATEDYLFRHYFPSHWGAKYYGIFYTDENSAEARKCREHSQEYMEKVTLSKSITSLLALNNMGEIVAVELSYVEEINKRKDLNYCHKCPYLYVIGFI